MPPRPSPLYDGLIREFCDGETFAARTARRDYIDMQYICNGGGGGGGGEQTAAAAERIIS